MQTQRNMQCRNFALARRGALDPADPAARDGGYAVRGRSLTAHRSVARRVSGFCLTRAALALLAASSATIAYAAIPASESAALQTFYNSTNGSTWGQNAGWNGGAGTECSAPPNAWYGVTCDAGGTHIIGIELGYNFLSGSLPDLSAFTALQVFHVNDNSLDGSIPNLSALGALQVFDAIGNYLTGPIPALSGLSNLSIFQVNGNQLSGSIPALTNLPNLQLFYVNDNLLTGSIPALTGLPSIEIMQLGGNQLSGSIPSFAGLATMSVFEADFNQLTGSIPSMSGLTALYLFNVGHNHLSGPVPIPANPSALVDGASILCPNSLTPNASAAWDAATGVAPWYSACDPLFYSGFESP